MEEAPNTRTFSGEMKDAYLINPLWSGIFFIAGGVITVVIGIVVFIITDASAVSDKVFAVEALIGGLLTDFLLRRYAHRRLVVGPKLTIAFVWIWPLLCLYVFIFEPLN